MKNPYKDVMNLQWLVHVHIEHGGMTPRRFAEEFGYELSAVERCLRDARRCAGVKELRS